jgi:allene oxide cyclase
MRTSLIVGVTAFAFAAGGTLAGVATATGAPASPSMRSHVLRLFVVERATTDTVVDTGPAGDSPGDLLTFANDVFDAANTHRVGHDNGSCVRTVAGGAYECEWTLTLRHGSLVVQGPFYDTADSTLAITGGTGRFSAARGQMVLHARNAAGTAYDFRYAITD